MSTHCFSMDVEGFCEGMAESITIPAAMLSSYDEGAEIERNVDETLAFLESYSVKGTFFILGRVAERLPAVVRRIAQAGHEIASHSFEHLRLCDLSRDQVRDSVVRSRKILEDVCGAQVKGFRAPDFSINRETWYILDLIQEAGYQYDSSLYPIRGHDLYGVRDLPRWVHRLPNGLVEYPLSILDLAGLHIPALGGGYFRLYPLAVTRQILRSIDKAGHSAMFYIHPYELGSVCPVVPGLSWSRKFRHYVSRAKTKKRFAELFRSHSFGRVEDILRSLGFLP